MVRSSGGISDLKIKICHNISISSYIDLRWTYLLSIYEETPIYFSIYK